MRHSFIVVVATLALFCACASDRSRPAPAGQSGTLRERYQETPETHTERPGKHSTTAGRSGTSGEVGGGIDAQSGDETVESRRPVLEHRQREERQAEQTED